ncbi:MAG TPA: hypothetical protein PLP07_00210 [Pyrinomonadaceae bacterium]|nr:hypothetical protein [Chloracidobacterium sp.]MBP9934384.1 hypothetical protein [Pyrinomonadaceae bacterium]MBK7801420.1 hypothetical protein [Chloracidobacterium sp.]MBK9766372.1 hypothetical protein [Chloracidobacterium sp.]MBL0241730.1 hypothetical protein [Chloracidobacterium sp.]
MANIEFYSGAIDASGCVSNGWNLVKQNYGLFLGITLVAMIIAGCIPCFSLFLVGPIMGGVFYAVLREMRGEPIEFGMMFKGFEKFVPLMVIGIIQSIPEIVGQGIRFTVDIGRIGLLGGDGGSDREFFQSSDQGLAIAGGVLIILAIVGVLFMLLAVVWRVLLVFAIPLAMEHDLGPVDAMKLSAKAATSNVGGLVVLFIFEALVALLGFLMLCVGLFFVMPIIYAANAFAYRQVFPLIEQNFQITPPPPTIYGSSYGRGM